MGQEIERKFLVTGDGWRHLDAGEEYCQGYLNSGDQTTVRVRTIGERGFITVKGPSEGYSRLEFEYEIPSQEAKLMLEGLCRKPLIRKRRYRIPYAGVVWEVDEFKGENRGLIVAEIELAAVDQPFARPAWIGREVTSESRYYNTSLVSFPYSLWRES